MHIMSMRQVGKAAVFFLHVVGRAVATNYTNSPFPGKKDNLSNSATPDPS